jgi:hypothetical protein
MSAKLVTTFADRGPYSRFSRSDKNEKHIQKFLENSDTEKYK